MTRTGRPSKLTPLRHRELVAALRLGYPLASAAARVGVHRDSVNNWRKRGEEALSTATEEEVEVVDRTLSGDQPATAIRYRAADPDEQIYLDLFVDLTRARADAEGFYLATLRRAADEGDTKAAMFMLERSFGYFRTERREVSEDVEIELVWGDEGRPRNGDEDGPG